MVNVKPKGPAVPVPTVATHSASVSEPRPVANALSEISSQAPPLMPRVAKMSSSGEGDKNC